MRKTTYISHCMLAYSTLQALIKETEKKSIWREESILEDDPLAHTIRVWMDNSRLPTSRYIHELIQSGVDDVQLSFKNIKMKLSRVHMYEAKNPQYSIHIIYTTKIGVNDLERVSWTRQRVSGYSLAVKKGPWNR